MWVGGGESEDYYLLIHITYGVRFSDLTGTDYSEGAVDLAQSLADRDGFTNVKFLVKIYLCLLLIKQICDVYTAASESSTKTKRKPVLLFVVFKILWRITAFLLSSYC